jgi:hypothetical protein
MSVATLRENLVAQFGHVADAEGRVYRSIKADGTPQPWGDAADPAAWSTAFVGAKAFAECIANAVFPEIIGGGAMVNRVYNLPITDVALSTDAAGNVLVQKSVLIGNKFDQTPARPLHVYREDVTTETYYAARFSKFYSGDTLQATKVGVEFEIESGSSCGGEPLTSIGAIVYDGIFNLSYGVKTPMLRLGNGSTAGDYQIKFGDADNYIDAFWDEIINVRAVAGINLLAGSVRIPELTAAGKTSFRTDIGAIGGSGTAGRSARFTPDENHIGSGALIDDGTKIGIGCTPSDLFEVEGNVSNSPSGTVGMVFRANGDIFPSIDIMRVNGVTKTNRQYRWDVNSDGESEFQDVTGSVVVQKFIPGGAIKHPTDDAKSYWGASSRCSISYNATTGMTFTKESGTKGFAFVNGDITLNNGYGLYWASAANGFYGYGNLNLIVAVTNSVEAMRISDGAVSIGNSTISAGLKVDKYFTRVATSDSTGLSVGGTYNDKTAHPVRVETVHPLANGNAVCAYDAMLTVTGVNHNHMVAFQSRNSWNGSGVLDDMYDCYFTSGSLGSGTITRRTSIYIADAAGSATTQTQYGIRIAALAKGTVANWAIYNEGAPIYTSGKLSIGTTDISYALNLAGTIALSGSNSIPAAGIGLNGNVLYVCGGTSGSKLTDKNLYGLTIANGGAATFSHSCKIAGAGGFNNVTPSGLRTHVADPSGGTTIDAEARTAINAILATLEAFGLHAIS